MLDLSSILGLISGLISNLSGVDIAAQIATFTDSFGYSLCSGS